MTCYLVSHSLHSSCGTINFGCPLTAHDCAAILYAIDKMQEYNGCMEIDFGNCGVRENQIKKFMNILDNKKGKLRIMELNLNGSKMTVSGLQALENAVRGNLFVNLEKLFLAASLTQDAETNATWLTTFINATLSHCPRLCYLDLSHNNLSVTGAVAISKNYDSEHQSCYLDLRKNNLGDSGLITLIENQKRAHLQLADNDIQATGVSCLADAVCSGKLVMHNDSGLNLSENPLGLEGTVAVCRMLCSSHCHQLHSINLSSCELTTTQGGLPTTAVDCPPNTDTLNPMHISCKTVGQKLCQMPQNSHITWLELNDNSFTGEGIHVLAGFMYLCLCLENLYTCDCGITSDDLIWLFDKLKSSNSSSNLCTKLERWSLGDNQIDDSGVLALMDHLPSLFPRLWTHQHSDLDNYNNPVSSETMKRLNEEVGRRRQEVSY